MSTFLICFLYNLTGDQYIHVIRGTYKVMQDKITFQHFKCLMLLAFQEIFPEVKSTSNYGA